MPGGNGFFQNEKQRALVLIFQQRSALLQLQSL